MRESPERRTPRWSQSSGQRGSGVAHYRGIALLILLCLAGALCKAAPTSPAPQAATPHVTYGLGGRGGLGGFFVVPPNCSRLRPARCAASCSLAASTASGQAAASAASCRRRSSATGGRAEPTAASASSGSAKTDQAAGDPSSCPGAAASTWEQGGPGVGECLRPLCSAAPVAMPDALPLFCKCVESATRHGQAAHARTCSPGEA